MGTQLVGRWSSTVLGNTALAQPQFRMQFILTLSGGAIIRDAVGVMILCSVQFLLIFALLEALNNLQLASLLTL